MLRWLLRGLGYNVDGETAQTVRTADQTRFRRRSASAPPSPDPAHRERHDSAGRGRTARIRSSTRRPPRIAALPSAWLGGRPPRRHKAASAACRRRGAASAKRDEFARPRRVPRSMSTAHGHASPAAGPTAARTWLAGRAGARRHRPTAAHYRADAPVRAGLRRGQQRQAPLAPFAFAAPAVRRGLEGWNWGPRAGRARAGTPLLAPAFLPTRYRDRNVTACGADGISRDRRRSRFGRKTACACATRTRASASPHRRPTCAGLRQAEDGRWGNAWHGGRPLRREQLVAQAALALGCAFFMPTAACAGRSLSERERLGKRPMRGRPADGERTEQSLDAWSTFAAVAAARPGSARAISSHP